MSGGGLLGKKRGRAVSFCLLICCQGHFCERCELMSNEEKRQQNTLRAKEEASEQIKAAIKALDVLCHCG